MSVIPVKYFRTIVLILLCGGISLADTVTVKTEWVDASLQYNVKDSSRQLESELVFPAQTVVGKIGYGHQLPLGTFSFSAYHSLVSIRKTGSDKDWKNSEMTVYSESTSTLNRLYGFEMAYKYPFHENGSIAMALFHEYWKLTWSDTKQYSYFDDRYDEIAGSTVQFIQQCDGARVDLKYGHILYEVPWSISAGMEISKQRSEDRHLARSFYTLSNEWAFGYSLDLDVEIFKYKTSIFTMGAGYSMRKSDADMEFFHENGSKFMTLPATFQTTVKSLYIRYLHSF